MNISETHNTPVDGYVPDFELLGIDDQVHHLSRYLDKFRAVCVVYLSHQCPYVELYIDRLKNIQTEFSSQGFTLIGLNGNSQENMDTMKAMKAFSDHYQLNFPYLWDASQDVTHSFGVQCTPTAFLVDNNGILRYKGQIDDHPHLPTYKGNDYLKNAIASLCEGQEIVIKETEEIGTTII